MNSRWLVIRETWRKAMQEIRYPRPPLTYRYFFRNVPAYIRTVTFISSFVACASHVCVCQVYQIRLDSNMLFRKTVKPTNSSSSSNRYSGGAGNGDNIVLDICWRASATTKAEAEEAACRNDHRSASYKSFSLPWRVCRMVDGGPEPACFVVKKGIVEVGRTGEAAMSSVKTEQGVREEDEEKGYR